jgi:hypothetical protein
MRKYIGWLLLFAVFFALGCAITDAQIDHIASVTEDTVQGMVDAGLTVAAPHVPGLSLLELLGGGGLGGILGALGGRVVRKLLKAIQKEAPNQPLVQP